MKRDTLLDKLYDMALIVEDAPKGTEYDEQELKDLLQEAGLL